MKLNFPQLERLTGSRSVLLAGMGGGFDVFCGLPLYFELPSSNQVIELLLAFQAQTWDVDDAGNPTKDAVPL